MEILFKPYNTYTQATAKSVNIRYVVILRENMPLKISYLWIANSFWNLASPVGPQVIFAYNSAAEIIDHPHLYLITA